MRAGIEGRTYERIFSLSNCALSEPPRITIKRNPTGVVSSWALAHLAVGMSVEVSDPGGTFTLQPGGRRVVFLAGGSGVTPVMSQLRTALHAGRDVTLLHVDRTASDAIFAADFERLARRYGGQLSYHPWYTGARGSPMGLVRELLGGHDGDVNLCGPEGFMQACRTAASDAGFDPARIAEESFGSSSGGIDGGLIEIKIEQPDGRERVVAGHVGRSLLESLRDEANLSGICGGRAICGTCRIAVRDDWINRLPQPGRAESRLLGVLPSPSAGHRLACQVRAAPEHDGIRLSPAPITQQEGFRHGIHRGG